MNRWIFAAQATCGMVPAKAGTRKNTAYDGR